jgi:hypothetical protein
LHRLPGRAKPYNTMSVSLLVSFLKRNNLDSYN